MAARASLALMLVALPLPKHVKVIDYRLIHSQPMPHCDRAASNGETPLKMETERASKNN